MRTGEDEGSLAHLLFDAALVQVFAAIDDSAQIVLDILEAEVCQESQRTSRE